MVQHLVTPTHPEKVARHPVSETRSLPVVGILFSLRANLGQACLAFFFVGGRWAHSDDTEQIVFRYLSLILCWKGWHPLRVSQRKAIFLFVSGICGEYGFKVRFWPGEVHPFQRLKGRRGLTRALVSNIIRHDVRRHDVRRRFFWFSWCRKTRMAKTILIVEDNDLNMKLFNDLLMAHGYHTLQTKMAARLCGWRRNIGRT